MLIGIDASRAFEPLRTGTENYSHNLISTLGKIDKKNNYRLYLRTQNAELKTQNWPRNFEFKLIGLPRLWTQLGLAFECLLRPPDILFIPAHTIPVIRRANLKSIVTIHDLGAEFLPGAHTFPQKLYLTFSTGYALRAATAIIAVSAATKNDLISKFGVDPEKIFVVYHGIDQNKFKIKNEKLKIEKTLKKYKIKRPYILFVGTIQPRKNLEKLIQAFALLAKSKEQRAKNNSERYALGPLQLVIVGKLGWLYDEILQAPKRFGIEKKVKFLNYIQDSDLPYIYAGAEVFVLPSLVEGFGLPVLEAMAAGIPVLVSNRTSLPEVGGNAAIYFNPQNSQEIAQAILQVLTNPKLRKDLVEKGKKQVAKFSWEKTAAQTLRVFERVYSERTGTKKYLW